jgi:Protein of unknown function (DUF3106)
VTGDSTLSGLEKIAITMLAGLCLTAAPAFAQRAVPRPRLQPGHNQRPSQKPSQKEDHEQRQAQKEKKEAAGKYDRVIRNHAGDWLRRYKDLPPDQQRQALEKDPDFQKLPPQRQTQLLQRLQHFSSLPSEQQERILSRMETWEHLTGAQKQQAKILFQQIQQLPPPRRRMLSTAVRGMRDLTPQQREDLINSDQYKGTFSDHERELLSGAARLPLAPGDNVGPGDTPDR